jgi:hypothetical protein
MKSLSAAVSFIALVLSFVIQPAAAEPPPELSAAKKRVALVIGNSAYVNAGTLANPVNDASDTAQVLKKFGFEVILGLNLPRPAFEDKIRAFSRALADADTAVLFYAGHGLQVAGHNYLIPVDAALGSERDLDFETISLDFALRQMEVGREGKTNIVFLDACRDNPLGRNLARSMGTRGVSVGSGLAEVQTGVGTFIAYSTQPGNVALDGKGRNSPFTASFTARMQEPRRNLTTIMIDVRNDVLAATGGRQVPWDHSALTRDFYFELNLNIGIKVKDAASPPEQPAPAQPGEAQPRHSLAGLPDQQLFAELDALAEAGSWPELYDRLADVRPTKRDAHWQELVEKAAIGELTPLASGGETIEELLAAPARYYPKFPSLRKSSGFVTLRAVIGVKAFRQCRGHDNCLQHSVNFFRTIPIPDLKLALDMAHSASDWGARALFYAQGLDAPGGSAVCADRELAHDIAFAMADSEKEYAKEARAVAEKCFEQVKDALIDGLAKNSQDYPKNTCELLFEHKALKGLMEKRCQAVAAK